MMCPISRPHSLAEQYDQTLHYTHDKNLPAGFQKPQPTACWPAENIALYERYRDWLLSGGTSEDATKTIYLPVAGHVLGLNLKPHWQLNLEDDLERALEYTRAKQCSKAWIKASHNGLEKFRRFLRLERGLGEIRKITPFDIPRHTAGLPAWLVSELERYQHLAQHNWRLAQLEHRIDTFWGKNMALWRFLCLERGVQQLADVKRSLILDYIDQRLAAGRAVSGVNAELRTLHSFLLFLQDEGYAVPQSLLRIPSLKQPDRLPKYLTDEQIRLLRAEIERRVRESSLASHKRLALLTRAAFYLLWQCGLRLGEVEELRLEDLDFGTNLSRHDLGRGKLTVRNGKGQKDRAVYLTDTTILALKDYLAVRGAGTSDHVFLYRNVLVKKDLIRAQLGYAGERVGVHVYPHRLRHTCATQLLNAGCRITSIQAFLGHKKLNTTMIYARAHDQTVSDDYFAAMQRVEQRLNPIPPEPEPEKIPNTDAAPEHTQVFIWLEQLAQPELDFPARLEIAAALRQALAITLAHSPPMAVLA